MKLQYATTDAAFQSETAQSSHGTEPTLTEGHRGVAWFHHLERNYMKSLLKEIWTEIVRAARQAPRLYAAPFVGACRHTRRVMRHIERENHAAWQRKK